MIQMYCHWHRGSPCCGFHCWHNQFEIKIVEMGFRQAQYHRCAAALGCGHDAFQKLETDQIECAHGITIMVGVVKHIAHVD